MTGSTPHGRSRYRHQGCRCEVCKEANRVAMAALRARKRDLTPVPSMPRSANAEATPTDEQISDDDSANAEPGPCVAAVLADIESMGDLRGRRALAAAAVQMARILDHPGAVTTQPSAAKQLDSLMTSLHKSAAPQRARLQAVQKMSARPGASLDAFYGQP
jgi:hypothetical protein